MRFKKIPTLLAITASLFCGQLFAATQTVNVVSVTKNRGSISTQSLSVLNVKDQSGTQDNWAKYVEASPANDQFIADFNFNYSVPANNVLTAINVRTNTIGEGYATQQWSFQILKPVTNQWVKLGDNKNANPWVWYAQVFTITTNPKDYIASNGKIVIRYISNNSYDVSNIDHLVVEAVTTSGGTSSQASSNQVSSSLISSKSSSSLSSLISSSRPSSVVSSSRSSSLLSSSRPASSLASSSRSSSSVASSAAGGWWKPTPAQKLTWQWQLTGTLDTSLAVNVYDIDLFDVSAAQIQSLKASGRKVICYFSAGTYEGWRPDWKTFFPFITGDSYTGNQPPFAGNMAEWDERWLDIRRIDLLAPIMRSRLDLAKQKGCDAVEPDNVDAYTNTSEVGLPLVGQDQLNYNRWLAQEAHARGLSIGLKNDVDQLAQLVGDFDWALNEQCFQYSECSGYSVFVNAGKAVFGVEYQGNAANFCPQANAMQLSWLKKNLSLDAARVGCETYQ